jgi:Tfp pilus assembly protein PilP
MVRSSTSLPAPSATVATAPTNGAVNALTNTAPTSEHALVGILNLGSRSAALFDVDGNSQRAYVGDRIGVSGWTLVSVNGQDVVVRREGEVRSIYIGQRF